MAARGAVPAPSKVSLGDLYQKCVQLVNENKVCSKNAFELKLIENMDEVVGTFMGGSNKRRASTGGRVSGRPTTGEEAEEHRFHEASHAVEASARIYAVRVDCVHTDTYKVLGGLNSADFGDEDEKGEDGKPTKRRRMIGVNTLERNDANITQQNIEADEMSDPMFRRMAAAFDAGGAKGLLMGHLPLAEDLSLVFNGDVPMNRASKIAQPLFAHPLSFKVSEIGLGDPSAAASRIAGTRLCAGLDVFRDQLFGKVGEWELSAELKDLLGSGVAPPPPPVKPAPVISEAQPLMDVDAAQDDDFGCHEPPSPGGPADFGVPAPDAGSPVALQPLGDAPVDPAPAAGEAAAPAPNAIADDFDELFEKFCGGGGPNQFAYFDECWAKQSKERADVQPLTNGEVPGPGGVLVAADGVPEQPKERVPKRPLFELSDLDKPVKAIDTEPAHKHQLSERALRWQLHKDVPPYMIDRITMPNWQTWSKCDFACLSLRPHLMMKLVRRPPPPGDGPHTFSDLFSTVVVENPDAYPWCASGQRRASDGADEGRGARPAGDAPDDAGEEFDDDAGLPAHLDADPQELFLRPDDHVVPGCEGGNGGFGDDGFGCDDGDDDDPYAGAFGNLGMDLDMVDMPKVCGSTEIGYSSNSKFVNVKLVKTHLWDCINEDLARTAPGPGRSESFQDLVNRTVKRMPKAEMENLSVQVAFICALHLCNERNLELERARIPGGDFAITGKHSTAAGLEAGKTAGR